MRDITQKAEVKRIFEALREHMDDYACYAKKQYLKGNIYRVLSANTSRNILIDQLGYGDKI